MGINRGSDHPSPRSAIPFCHRRSLPCAHGVGFVPLQSWPWAAERARGSRPPCPVSAPPHSGPLSCSALGALGHGTPSGLTTVGMHSGHRARRSPFPPWHPSPCERHRASCAVHAPPRSSHSRAGQHPPFPFRRPIQGNGCGRTGSHSPPATFPQQSAPSFPSPTPLPLLPGHSPHPNSSLYPFPSPLAPAVAIPVPRSALFRRIPVVPFLVQHIPPAVGAPVPRSHSSFSTFSRRSRLFVPRSHSSFTTFPQLPWVAASIPLPDSGHPPRGRHFAPSAAVRRIVPAVDSLAPSFPFLIQDISPPVGALGPRSRSGHCGPRTESRPWERARHSPFRIRRPRSPFLVRGTRTPDGLRAPHSAPPAPDIGNAPWLPFRTHGCSFSGRARAPPVDTPGSPPALPSPIRGSASEGRGSAFQFLRPQCRPAFMGQLNLTTSWASIHIPVPNAAHLTRRFI